MATSEAVIDRGTAPARVALFGAGLMGTGLARLFTRVGFYVAVWDVDGAALERLSLEVPAVHRATSLEESVHGVDFVIEAVAEKLPVKRALFAELAANTAASTVLATNSSVIPVGAISRDLTDADAARTLGTHFWNPPDLIPLVEVIAGPRTSPASVSTAIAMLERAGREPVRVDRDVVPGNRLQHALWREAMALVDEGVCSPEVVDQIVKRGFGARLAVLGPLENADLVGLELTEQIHRVVLPTLSRATLPADGLRRRIKEGRLGASAGAGFYATWSAQRMESTRQRLSAHLQQWFSTERA